ncbi:hypothetical protein ACLOJK_034998, partial [Asimina triloba]
RNFRPDACGLRSALRPYDAHAAQSYIRKLFGVDGPDSASAQAVMEMVTCSPYAVSEWGCRLLVAIDWEPCSCWRRLEMENDGATMLPLIQADEGMVLDVVTPFRLPITNLPLKETEAELLLEFMIRIAIFDFCQFIQAAGR